MLYEVRATMFFDTIQIPEDIKQALLTVWEYAQVVNPGMPNQECSTFDVFKCFHDEFPHKPCKLIFHKDNCSPEPE